MAGRRLEESVAGRVREMFRRGVAVAHIAKRCGVNRTTVYAVVGDSDHRARGESLRPRPPEPAAQAPAGPVRLDPDGLPVAEHESPPPGIDESGLPEPVPLRFDHFALNEPARWLVVCDAHIPYHDRATLLAAARHGKYAGVGGVLLNGDMLDSHAVSRHDKDPSAPRYVKEIETARAFLAWLRREFPKARIVYKEGNHEDRLPRYLASQAPALSGIPGVDVPTFLDLKSVGVEWVADKRPIHMGLLTVLHGHELHGGGGQYPARSLYSRARVPALCGHHHRVDEFRVRGARNAFDGAWTVGASCWLHPAWKPLNDWEHGFAVVEVSRGGEFTVENRRVVNGRVF